MMNNIFVYKRQVIQLSLSTLLICMHFLYTFYLWLVDLTIFKKQDPLRDRTVNEHKEYELKKKPNHLVISLCQEEEVFYEHLAKLLAWTILLEIPVISFYHNEDELSPEELFFAIRALCSSLMTKINWGLGFSDEVKTESLKCINGYKWEPKIQVNILTSKHSKLQLVNALHTMCSTEEEFSDILVESAINKTFPIVKPDLVIICGESCTTFGLLPWHTRVTEFFMLKTHNNVIFSKFYNIMEEYSRHEQRYGK